MYYDVPHDDVLINTKIGMLRTSATTCAVTKTTQLKIIIENKITINLIETVGLLIQTIQATQVKNCHCTDGNIDV